MMLVSKISDIPEVNRDPICFPSSGQFIDTQQERNHEDHPQLRTRRDFARIHQWILQLP